MRKRSLKAFSAMLLTIILSLVLTGSAYATTMTSDYDQINVNGIVYEYYSVVTNNSTNTWAYTSIRNYSNEPLPYNYMQSWARLYNDDDILVACSTWSVNPANTSGLTAVTAGYNIQGIYYSCGKVRMYYGPNSKEEVETAKTPYIMNGYLSPPKDYFTNANGESVGYSGYNAEQIGEEPDLIAAYGINGNFGYVRASDLEGDAPDSEEDVAEINSTGKTINVYASDGETVVDTFYMNPGYTDKCIY